MREKLINETSALKSAVFGLIKNRRLETAAQVIGLYAGINPGDPDIKTIKNIIGLCGVPGSSLPDKIEVLSETETVFVLWDATVMGNGLVYSAFRKVKLMEDNWGVRPLILSCRHSLEFRSSMAWLKYVSRGENKISLNEDTRVMNVFEFFQKSYAEGLPVKTVFSESGEGVLDVYEEGALVRKERYTRYGGGLRAVSHYENGLERKTVFYDDWGYVNSVREGDEVRYYDTDGNLRITRGALGLTVYDGSGNVLTERADEGDLAALCLESVTGGSGKYLVVMENDETAKPYKFAEKDNVILAAVLHNVFLEDPYDTASPAWFPYRNICANRGSFDAVIMLTEAEKRDFAAKYGPVSGVFVIPHPYPYAVKETDFDKRDHKKAVMVARFDEQKRVDRAIEIFGEAALRVPGIRLEIYGFGALESNYEELIGRLGLSDTVFLMGPASDPASVFGGAAVFMMTSAYEGYPLVLAESVCNGCPVFSYDIKYGPAEVIKDGETGRLIPRNDREAFVSGLVEFFSDIERQRAMSRNCYADAGRFAPEEFLERWYLMMKSVCRSAPANAGSDGQKPRA